MMNLSLLELSKQLHRGNLSSVELAEHCLNAINQNKNLNAFISLDEEGTLEQARAADQLLQAKQGKLLTGIPMAVKDLFCTQSMNTTCGSKMLGQFKSPYEATLVTKLREQGSIVLGKTNMDEFAMGSANENSFFGPVKNPWDNSRVSGGSSGGSAVAVAAGMAPFALGSDTGGSIRQPAAFCGISGIKPTYGLISRFGMVAYASSLDQAGPMAKSAEDLAILLQCMVGFDPKDSTSIQYTAPDYSKSLSNPINNYRIGLPRSFLHSGTEPEIEAALQEAIKLLEQQGAQIIEIDLNYQSLWIPCYYVIACAEASSNLSRYDGIRYGHRSTKGDSLKELIQNSRNEGFGDEVKRRILTGTHVLSSGYFDAYYLQALKIRRLIQEEFLSKFNEVDVILGPTTPTPAFKIGETVKDPVKNYLADVFTVASNLAGLPALSIPMGFSGGLPIGMQLMGKHFSETTLLHIAHQYQQQTDWHNAKPLI